MSAVVCLQVSGIRNHLSMAMNELRVGVDSVVVRAFVSYMVRRHNGSKRKVNWHDHV